MDVAVRAQTEAALTQQPPLNTAFLLRGHKWSPHRHNLSEGRDARVATRWRQGPRQGRAQGGRRHLPRVVDLRVDGGLSAHGGYAPPQSPTAAVGVHSAVGCPPGQHQLGVGHLVILEAGVAIGYNKAK